MSPATTIVANPLFAHRRWRVHASRNYLVGNSVCATRQPQGLVGPPVP